MLNSIEADWRSEDSSTYRLRKALMSVSKEVFRRHLDASAALMFAETQEASGRKVAFDSQVMTQVRAPAPEPRVHRLFHDVSRAGVSLAHRHPHPSGLCRSRCGSYTGHTWCSHGASPRPWCAGHWRQVRREVIRGKRRCFHDPVGQDKAG